MEQPRKNDIRRPSSPRRRRGFTLVEMIVSLGVFSVVAVVALGALVKIVSANKKAQSLQSSITNLNFALDAMSRELRTGTTYFCEANNGTTNYRGSTLAKGACPSGSISSQNTHATLAFKSSETIIAGAGSPCVVAYAYRFKPDNDVFVLEKAVQSACDDSINGSDFESIVDDNVNITGYYLKVSGTGHQHATIRISGYAGVREREKTYFDVQTTVSSRAN
ncbi:MAG: type II secretion system protein [Patescibacteria group bacterium]